MRTTDFDRVASSPPLNADADRHFNHGAGRGGDCVRISREGLSMSKAAEAQAILDQNIAQAVQYIRAGYTYKEAAAAMGKSLMSVKGWCAGRVTLSPAANRRTRLMDPAMKSKQVKRAMGRAGQ